jgi:hypothetical protein
MEWQILDALSELAAAQGHSERAERLCSDARRILEFIIERIPTEDLRETFETLPDVRRIMEA